MLRRLLKDSAIYTASTLLSRGIALLMIPFYTRALSPEEYGVMDMLTIFGILATQVITLQITQGLARYFADADDLERRTLASSGLWFSLSGLAIFGTAGWLLAAPLSRILLGSAHVDVFRLSVLAVVGNGMFYFFQNQLRWQLQPLRYGIASLLYAVTNAGIAFYTIYIAQAGVGGFFAAQIVGALVGLCIAWFYSRHLYGFVVDRTALRSLLIFSIPLVPSSLFVVTSTYVDRFIINLLMSVGDVGLYGIGFRFASIVSLVMVGIQGALTPLIYSRYREESTPVEIARLFRLFCMAAMPLVLFITCFSREFLGILTGPEYHAAWPIVPLLSVASLVSGLYIFAPGLDIAKRTKTIAAVNLVAVLVNVVFNFALIPLWGIVGAAMATCISAVSMFAGYRLMGERSYPVPHQWSRLVMAGTLLVLAMGMALQLSTLTAVLKLGFWALASLGCLGILLSRDEVSWLSRRMSLHKSGDRIRVD